MPHHEQSMTIVVDDDPRERRDLVLLELARGHDAMVVEDALDRFTQLGRAWAPTALIADQRALGIHLPLVAAKLATVSPYPRLVLVGDGEHLIPVTMRAALGIFAVLVRPIALDLLFSLVDSLYVQQRCHASTR